MTDTLSLAQYVELASQRHNGASGRRLAEVAANHGYDVSHSTLNRIRRGTYTSRPTLATLDAIAFLAAVEPADVYAAEGVAHTTHWREYEATFFQYYEQQERLNTTISRYATLRGLGWNEAADELLQVVRHYHDFQQGRGDWDPPWCEPEDDDVNDGPPPQSAYGLAARTEDHPKEDPQ
ncbi:hypothetical protein [Mycolicibacterium sp. F2034L]|uniref:hypothetical protein n=1 Tax=Mycolicibacterium sp. F2034L TaxID=2926422 RepID=UPI001FF119D9|nr:hypothetical protein [Mycolicibacterium sp. F2034L]MCK0174767.1 hypothetical protein [Mycolicibacterium sp. F2034L]